MEIRSAKECRAESADGRTIEGFAIVFNSLSLDLGGFREQIAPEAVDRTLKSAADVRAFLDHDSGKILGRTHAGTLTLRKTPKGLLSIIEPDPRITYAGDALRSVQRGDLSQMSFGFRVVGEDESWWDFSGDTPIRTVRDMEISEVSIVAMPAYPQTSVEVAQRSLMEFREAFHNSPIALKRRLVATWRAA